MAFSRSSFCSRSAWCSTDVRSSEMFGACFGTGMR
jgi:hypothetical protein